MTTPRTFVFLAVALAGLTSTAVSQVITGFGSAEENPFDINTDFVSPWTGSQSATTVSVSNVSNQAGGIFQNLSSSVFLPSPVSVSLTGTANSVPGVTQFDIVLYDAALNTLTGSFHWSSFSGGATVLADLVEEGGFDGTVVSWELNLFGAPAETVSFTFDDLTVVPEPAVAALLGGAGVVMLLLRRRHGPRA